MPICSVVLGWIIDSCLSSNLHVIFFEELYIIINSSPYLSPGLICVAGMVRGLFLSGASLGRSLPKY